MEAVSVTSPPEAAVGLHASSILWATIFGKLSLLERHTLLPLVCRDWRRLVNSPCLLRTIKLELIHQSLANLCRLRQFSQWLVLHASTHIQELKLTWPTKASPPEDAALAALLADTQADVAASLAACGGGLTDLRFHGYPRGLKVGTWAAALGRLRCLHLTSFSLDSAHHLEVTASLRGLTGLEELWLVGDSVVLPPAPCLPASLTKLRLGAYAGEDLPHQLAPLSMLRTLGLYHAARSLGGPGALSGLTALRQLALELSPTDCLPPSLALLSSLDWLRISGGHPRDHPGTPRAQQLNADLDLALQRLTRLTELSLSVGPAITLPTSLDALSRLQRFQWDAPPARPITAPAVLPEGPWLASLRWLWLPADVLASSLAVLAAAEQLECLVASGAALQPGAEQLRLVDWAAEHPTLRSLFLSSQRMNFGDVKQRTVLDLDSMDGLLEAARRKPALHLHYSPKDADFLRSPFTGSYYMSRY